MILLIAGASHTGKTLLAQRLLEKYGYPYLSIDHLKMGLIRDNAGVLEQCRKYGVEYTLIDGIYPVDIGGGAE